MPKICEFAGMKIYLYYDDHEPPHFHVRGHYKTRMKIQDGTYLKGDPSLPKKYEKQVLIWLNKHRNDIIKAWEDCMEGKSPGKIPPLA